MQRFFLIVTAMVLVAGLGAALAADPVPFVPVQNGFTTAVDQVEPYATDRLLVQFAAGKVPADLAALPFARGASLDRASTTVLDAFADALRGARLTTVERPYDQPRRPAPGVDRWFMLRLQTDEDLADLAARLRRLDGIDAVSLDWRAFPMAVPSDPLYPDHWGHNNTGQLPSYDWNSHTQTGPLVGTPGFDAQAEQAWDAPRVTAARAW
jgi:hypothetical protein